MPRKKRFVMQAIKIWHNPRCSKSREGLNILETSGFEAEVIRYLEKDLDIEELKAILKMLGLSPRELMRTTEAIYKELKLKEENDDNKLIEAMVNHPKLIQRPIIVKGDKAIIGRPSSIIADFLKA